MKKIKLDEIIIDGGTQTRAALNEDTISDYAEAMTEGAKFPTVVVFASGTAYLLADGFHRFMAARRCGWLDIDCNVKTGSKLDAIKYALGANNVHGLRRTNADKRRGVEIALKEFGKLSDQAIADMCGVGRNYVLDIRHEIPPQPVVKPQVEIQENQCLQDFHENQPVAKQQVEKRIGVDGKERSMPAPPRDPGPPPTPPAQEKDPNGKVIPAKLLSLWRRRQEIQDFCTQISRIRTTIEQGVEDKDKLFAEANPQSVKAALDQAYTAIKATMPYCLCPSCQGEGCRACAHRGLIGKFRFDTVIPEELK